MALFGSKKVKAPSRVNDPKNKPNVTKKKAKYPLFKGYNPHGGPGRGMLHKKTPREARLNKAWDILSPPGKGEGPGYSDKIQARVEELKAITNKTKIDTIELAYLEDLQKNMYLDNEDFKWANYNGKAEKEWENAAQAEWTDTFIPVTAPTLTDPLPPPPSTPPPSSPSTSNPSSPPPSPSAAPVPPIPMKGPLKTPLPPRPVPGSTSSTTISSSSNINSTIKRMKCIVCNSQFIIYDGLGKKGEAPKCGKCNSSVVTTVNPPIKNNNPQKGINTNLLKSNIPINTSVNIVNETTKMASAYKNLETMSKSRALNNALKNNGFSINAAGRGAKAENNANAAVQARVNNLVGNEAIAYSNAERMVEARSNDKKKEIKARLIKVQNEEGKNIWIDPKDKNVYLNANATSDSPYLLGGPNSNNKYWRYNDTKGKSIFIKPDNYNKFKNKLQSGGKTRKYRSNKKRTTRKR